MIVFAVVAPYGESFWFVREDAERVASKVRGAVVREVEGRSWMTVSRLGAPDVMLVIDNDPLCGWDKCRRPRSEHPTTGDASTGRLACDMFAAVPCFEGPRLHERPPGHGWKRRA